MAGRLHSIVLAVRHAGLHATGYLEQSDVPALLMLQPVALSERFTACLLPPLPLSPAWVPCFRAAVTAGWVVTADPLIGRCRAQVAPLMVFAVQLCRRS